jgi:hypothetical protein
MYIRDLWCHGDKGRFNYLHLSVHVQGYNSKNNAPHVTSFARDALDDQYNKFCNAKCSTWQII